MTDEVNFSKMLVSVIITAQNICIHSDHIQGVQLQATTQFYYSPTLMVPATQLCSLQNPLRKSNKSKDIWVWRAGHEPMEKHS